jgi:hypothetical protein
MSPRSVTRVAAPAPHRRPPSAVIHSKSHRPSGRPCSSLVRRAVRGGAAAPSGEGLPAGYGRALPVLLPGRACGGGAQGRGEVAAVAR